MVLVCAAGAYYVRDPTLGEQCYLCDVESATTAAATAAGGGKAHVGGGSVRIVPRDAYRIAAYLEPLGVYLTSQVRRR